MAIFIFLSLLYVVYIIWMSQRMILSLEHKLEQQMAVVNRENQRLLEKKERLNRKRNELQNSALEIFTLYEITKNISKTLKEADAFELFKKTLEKHVQFKSCQFLHPDSEELKKIKTLKDHVIFPLLAKDKKIGYLVLEGLLSSGDEEKMYILGHQFSLSLRRVQLYEEIERIAITDSLTDAHTRRYVLERFEEEIKRSRGNKLKLSFLMIDVDHFKSYNDQYGHLAGDQILRGISHIIRESIREIDIIGRYGGEEFCVVLPDTDRQGAEFAAERIRLAVQNNPIKAYDATVRVTVSVGVATFPENGTEVHELIDKADWALYRAKKLGRNRVCLFGTHDK